MKKIALVAIFCMMILIVPVIASEVVTVHDINIPSETIEKSYYITEYPMTVKNMMPLEEMCLEC